MCNFIGPSDFVAERERTLREHCEAVSRNPAEIERTVTFRQPVIRDSADEAKAVAVTIGEHHKIDPPFLDLAGTVDSVVEELTPYVLMGYRHLIFQFLAPFDDETMERLVAQVKPELEAIPDSRA